MPSHPQMTAGASTPRDAMSAAERRPLAAIVLWLAVQYAVYGLFRHWRLGSSAYDLGIFDQAVWHLSRFEAPASTISGFANIFGDHFSPILIVLAPLYWIWSGPETLIVAQALLLAGSAIPIYALARDAMSASAAAALTFAYGQYWGLQRAAAFDVHELAFAPLFIATALWAMARARTGVLLASLMLLAAVKEDMLVVVAGIGALLMLRGQVRLGLGVAVGAVAGFLVIVSLVVPAFNESGTYAYAGAFPDVRDPMAVLARLVDPPRKLYTVVLWLAPFLFLPLLSPTLVVMAPLALSRLLSTSPNHWGPSFHYSAPIAPLVAAAAFDALRRLGLASAPAWARRLGLALIVACCLILPGNQPLWDLFKARHYQATPATAAMARALAQVPPEASVVAQDAAAPHLSHRRDIHLLRPGAPLADAVVLVRGYSAWPNPGPREVDALVAGYRDAGYVATFDESGWTVMTRPR